MPHTEESEEGTHSARLNSSFLTYMKIDECCTELFWIYRIKCIESRDLNEERSVKTLAFIRYLVGTLNAIDD